MNLDRIVLGFAVSLKGTLRPTQVSASLVSGPGYSSFSFLATFHNRD
jgi:hypothetical protein